MADKLFDSLEALEAIVRNNTPESLTLEYKGSAIFQHPDRAKQSLCKGITAFANSAGGHFIIGIEATQKQPIRLDGGIPAAKHDWIHQIINSNVQPSLETFEVFELPTSTGFYYSIKIDRSPRAPHQLGYQYYKRRGPESIPMEHYEIEDVRSRPQEDSMPLRIDLMFQGLTAFLRVKNEHAFVSLTNIKCQIETNFTMDRRGVESLCSRGLRSLRPLEELHFLLDSTPPMIEKTTEPEMHIRLSYDFRGAVVRDTISYYLADLIHSAIVRPPMVEAIEGISEKLDQVQREIARLRADSERLLSITDGSGLRLSARTLEQLSGSKRRFSPTEFDWRGYAIIVGIPLSEALALHRVFHAFGHVNGPRDGYQKLSASLREKFEMFFDVDLAIPSSN